MEDDVPLDFFIAIKQDYQYYLNNPFLFTQTIRKDTLDAGSVVGTFKRYLDLGYYIDTYLNEQYVPFREAFKRNQPYYHDNLLYGYDEQQGCFQLAGYSPDGKYVTGTISFDALETAYRTCPAEKYYKNLYLYHLAELRDGSPIRSYRFDSGRVYAALFDYLHARNSSADFALFANPAEHLAFGFDCYENVIQNLAKPGLGADLRPIYTLYEHKKLLCDHARYLQVAGCLRPNDYDALSPLLSQSLALARAALLIQIKNTVSAANNDPALFGKIQELARHERPVIQRLLQALIVDEPAAATNG
ncbi:hypothetical protein B5M42_000970 [Paenibacillus athensensis]|uniref:Uncharacterized protein n=1 Tax=Paenibacillus athensensis TaxID=1967502 RepID=A0A4Y8Q716_9BACL|nr:hypothetical protein [Paenibacillus athensensis]MCD1257407.1 hypothetical protein [Paenibacillus athensensis]